MTLCLTFVVLYYIDDMSLEPAAELGQRDFAKPILSLKCCGQSKPDK